MCQRGDFDYHTVGPLCPQISCPQIQPTKNIKCTQEGGGGGGGENQTPGLNMGRRFLLSSPKQYGTTTMHNICIVLGMLRHNAEMISSTQEDVHRFFVTTMKFHIRCSWGSSHPQIPRAAVLFFWSLPFQSCYHCGLGYLVHCGFSPVLGTQLRSRKVIGLFAELVIHC